MRSFAIIQRDTFVGKGWLPHRGYSFCRSQTTLPLVAAELTKAAAAMPIALIRDQNTGHFQLIGLCSLDEGRNLFVAPDGKWLGGYVPAVLRGYPFGLARVENSEQVLLAIDEASGLVVNNSEANAQPFFDKQGAPADTVRQILGFLTQVDANLITTNRALLHLQEADLIVPWTITLNTEGNTKNVNGLFRIDIDKIRSLNNNDFLKLRENDALFLAFNQSFSTAHINIFETLSQIQNKMEDTNKIHKKTIENSFAVIKDDDIKFDWSNI